MGPYHFLVGSLITPEDDFGQRLRKNTVAAFFFIGCLVTLAYSVIVAIDMAQSGTPYNITRFLQNVIQFTACLGVYLSMRKTRHVGDVQAAVLPWVCLLAQTARFLYVPYSDNKTLAIGMALCAVFLQIAKLPIFLVVALIYALVADWNVSHVHTNPELLLVLPGYLNNRTGSAIFTNAVLTTLYACLGVIIFIFVVRESERRGAAQKAANEMTFNILKHQRKYDTQQVSRILLECRDAKVVDPELIKMFQEMNENLESYRPWLPNYLFLQQEVEVGGEAGQDGGMSNQQNPRVRSGRSIGLSLVPPVAENPMIPSSAGSGHRGSGSETPLSSIGSGEAPDEMSPTLPSSALASPLRSAVIPVPCFSRSCSPVPAHLAQRGQPTPVSVALVDLANLYHDQCPAVVLMSRGGGSSDPVSQALSKVVDLIFTLADEARAAVHNLTGDVVTLSWNTVGGHCPQHQLKATRFLMKILAFVGGAGGGVSGALWSGMANHDTIFTSGASKTNVAQLLHAPWLKQLHTSFELAKRYGTVIVDAATRECIKYDYEVLAVDRVSTSAVAAPGASGVEAHLLLDTVSSTTAPPQLHSNISSGSGTDSDGTILFEVLGECEQVEVEWMYHVAKVDSGSPTGSANITGGGRRDLAPLLQAMWSHKRGETFLDTSAGGSRNTLTTILSEVEEISLTSSPMGKGQENSRPLTTQELVEQYQLSEWKSSTTLRNLSDGAKDEKGLGRCGGRLLRVAADVFSPTNSVK